MFRDADQAIRFAFRMRDKSIITSMTFRDMDSPGSTATDRLTVHDFHAMSAMLFAYLGRCPAEQQAAAYLLYGSDAERWLSAKVLAEFCGGRFPKYITTKGQLVQALTSKTVRDCADQCGLTNYKAWKVRREMWKVVEPHLWKLHESLEKWLKLDKAC
jgi:hypothetical protein